MKPAKVMPPRGRTAGLWESPSQFQIPHSVEEAFIRAMECPHCHSNLLLNQAPPKSREKVYCPVCGWTPRVEKTAEWHNKSLVEWNGQVYPAQRHSDAMEAVIADSPLSLDELLSQCRFGIAVNGTEPFWYDEKKQDAYRGYMRHEFTAAKVAAPSMWQYPLEVEQEAVQQGRCPRCGTELQWDANPRFKDDSDITCPKCGWEPSTRMAKTAEWDGRLVRGQTRLRYRGDDPKNWNRSGLEAGAMGTFGGGADYVPGLDAGSWSVFPDDYPEASPYGHRAMAYWTSESMFEQWEPIDEDDSDSGLTIPREWMPAPEPVMAKVARHIDIEFREGENHFLNFDGSVAEINTYVAIDGMPFTLINAYYGTALIGSIIYFAIEPDDAQTLERMQDAVDTYAWHENSPQVEVKPCLWVEWIYVDKDYRDTNCFQELALYAKRASEETGLPIQAFFQNKQLQRVIDRYFKREGSEFDTPPLANPVNYQWVPWTDQELQTWYGLPAPDRARWKRKAKSFNYNARHRGQGASGNVAGRDLWLLINRYQGNCAYCGQDGGDESFDHVIPLALGGTNTVDNLLPCHLTCNRELNELDNSNRDYVDPTDSQMSPNWFNEPAEAKVSMAVTPDQWRDWQIEKKKLYHVTHRQFLNNIQAEGLRPASEVGHARDDEFYAPRPGTVYLFATKDDAIQSGRYMDEQWDSANPQYGDVWNDPVLLEVDAMQLDPQKFVADEDYAARSPHLVEPYYGRPPEDEPGWPQPEGLGEWADRVQLGELDDDSTDRSINEHWTVGYKGTIPPSAIRVDEDAPLNYAIYNIDPEERRQYMYSSWKLAQELPSWRKLEPHPELRELAHSYMAGKRWPYSPPKTYPEVDESRAQAIADEYERMPHTPNDPYVRSAYMALANETADQYQHLVDNGYKFEFDPGDVYNSPWDASKDVRDNKHLYVYPTSAGYGQGEIDEHPLLQDSGHTWGGQPVTYNDLFRGVHDVFGHAKEGVGFRHHGEENAWRQHSAMYSDLARHALTSETRGQNSWVNYGPHGEHNQQADQANTIYAPQKAGLLPEWATWEGAHDHYENTNPWSVLSMAEQTGDPQVDSLIEKFMDENWGYLEDYQIGDCARGECADVSEFFAKWMRDHGADAEIHDITDGAGEGDPASTFQDAGYGDAQYRDPEGGWHTTVEVRAPSGTYMVDFTASQYGYKEFPMVQKLDSDKWQRQWS